MKGEVAILLTTMIPRMVRTRMVSTLLWPENGRARGRNASAGGIWNIEFACDDEFMDAFYHWYCMDDFFYGIAWIEKEEAHSSVENDDADLMLVSSVIGGLRHEEGEGEWTSSWAMRPRRPFSPLASWRLLVGEPDVRTRYSERDCCHAPMTGSEAVSTEDMTSVWQDWCLVALCYDGSPCTTGSRWTLPFFQPARCTEAEFLDDLVEALCFYLVSDDLYDLFCFGRSCG